jgi:hypothetical protein
MYLPGAVLLGMVPAALTDGTFQRAARSAVGRSHSPETAAHEDGNTAADDNDAAVDGFAARLPGIDCPRAYLGERGRAVAYPAVSLLLALLLVLSYGGALAEPYNQEQREIGQTVATEVPEGETVAVWLAGNLTTQSLMTVSFYADRPLENVSTTRLRTDESIRYAIVPPGRETTLNRNHRVLAEGPANNATVVAFSD